MFERRNDLLGGVVVDSFRRSLIVVVPECCFIEEPPDERRASSTIRDVPVVPCDDLGLDRLVTCIMVVWAVSIFAGMSYLAAII